MQKLAGISIFSTKEAAAAKALKTVGDTIGAWGTNAKKVRLRNPFHMAQPHLPNVYNPMQHSTPNFRNGQLPWAPTGAYGSQSPKGFAYRHPMALAGAVGAVGTTGGAIGGGLAYRNQVQERLRNMTVEQRIQLALGALFSPNSVANRF